MILVNGPMHASGLTLTTQILSRCFISYCSRRNYPCKNFWSLKWLNGLFFLDQEGFSSASKGPYWFGQKLSLVDLSLYPHFERFPVLTEYRGMNIPRSCWRLRAWLDVMRERFSVVVTAREPGFHIEAYTQYANGTASGTTANDMRI